MGHAGGTAGVGVAALRLLSTCFSYDDVASMTEKYQHEPSLSR